MRQLCILLVFWILSGCVDNTLSSLGPLEGIWEMQYYEWHFGDTVITWTADETHKMTKAFGKETFVMAQMDPLEDGSGGLKAIGGSGNYKLKGDTLYQTFELFAIMELLGELNLYRIKLSNDSLFQEGPLRKLGEENDFQLYEIYKRRE